MAAGGGPRALLRPAVCLIVNPSAGAGRAARLLPASRRRCASSASPSASSTRRSSTPASWRARRSRRARWPRRWAATGCSAPSPASCATPTACSGCCPAGAATTSRASSGSAPTRSRPATCSPRARARIDVADVDGRAFLGIASAGLDSDAGDRQRHAPAPRRARLRLRALRALRAWRPARWDVAIDGAAHSFTGYSVAVANSGVFGGGMHLAPERQARRRPARRRADRGHPQAHATWPTLPKVFTGAHVREPGRRAVRPRGRLRRRPPVHVYADGDPIAELPATVRVQPGCARTSSPRDACSPPSWPPPRPSARSRAAPGAAAGPRCRASCSRASSRTRSGCWPGAWSTAAS